MISGTAKDAELERDTMAYEPEVSRKQKMKVGASEICVLPRMHSNVDGFGLR
jgi:hypothetical protein